MQIESLYIENIRKVVFIIALFTILFANSYCQKYSYAFKNIEDDLTEGERSDYGKLTGDVQNWAAIIQNYIIQSANDLINRDLTQELFDLANYTVENKHGEEVVKEVKETLSNYFSQKQAAAIVSHFFFVGFIQNFLNSNLI